MKCGVFLLLTGFLFLGIPGIPSASEKVKTKDPVMTTIAFPEKWLLFAGVEPDLKSGDLVKSVPSEISGVRGIPVRLKEHCIDFGTITSKKPGTPFLLFAEIDSPEEQEYLFGAGADWSMQYFVNGKMILDTMSQFGNVRSTFFMTDHVIRTRLPKGKSVLAILYKTGIHAPRLSLGGTVELVPYSYRIRIADGFKSTLPDPEKIHKYPMDGSTLKPYTLPDPLLRPDGTRVATAAEWVKQREYILSLLKTYEYGDVLPRPDTLNFKVMNRKEDALGGTAIRKEILIACSMNNGKSFSFLMLLYVPKKHCGPVPCFLGLNFKGNHTTTEEPDVTPTGWIRPGVLEEKERGCQKHRWTHDSLVARGYASATICYHDIHPDKYESEDHSVFRLFFKPEEYRNIGKKYSVIGAWAWGLSRALDCLEADPDINASRVAVHGHSRLGKTSLWAGAVDPRFRMVISNCSGCAGGTLHRRRFGENLSNHFDAHTVYDNLPVWLVDRCADYIWREDELPIDQHELLAMMAPRPLAIGTATKDLAADPEGEFLACKAASEVYRLFGSAGLPAETMPAPDVSVKGDISFHCRTGIHDQTPQDLAIYMDLADRFLK